ncbi:MAG TPA: hypothetical protein VLT85_04395 [Terriglobales bacterium]|nr:hypothetical protein [Terriglobales bacterium]
MATSKRARTRSTTPGAALRLPADTTAPDAGAAPTIATILADLADKQARLTDLIDAADPGDTRTLIRLFSLYAQIASRMGRLLRDQRALSGQAADGIAGAIAQALDELSSELGQPL